MNQSIKILHLAFLSIYLLSFSSCDGIIPSIPEAKTYPATYILDHSAIVQGEIVSDGGAKITESGICWSKNPLPTMKDSISPFNSFAVKLFYEPAAAFYSGECMSYDGSGTGATLAGLTENTKYYARTYCANWYHATYGNEVQFTTEKTINNGIVFNSNLTYGTVTDIDNNVYKTIKIGEQTWMAENLRTTRYRNGDNIIVGDLCNDDHEANYLTAIKFGKLYRVAHVVDKRNLAPIGWHVASEKDWSQLADYLLTHGYNYDGSTEGNKIAKSLAATTDWSVSDTIGSVGNNLTNNNSTGFTALPTGYMYWSKGPAMPNLALFYNASSRWWSFSTNDNLKYCCFNGYSFVVNQTNINISTRIGSAEIYNYFSIRCVKD
jgi:uncharacterized protein (TIGR02145 family)